MVVSEQIIQVLNYLGTKFGIVIDWTSENVLPYLETLFAKLITWEVWSSVAWIGIMTVISVILVIVAVKTRIFTSEFYEDWDILAVLLNMAFIIVWLATVICVGTQIFDIIKCVTFPEMHVYEYIQRLLNRST